MTRFALTRCACIWGAALTLTLATTARAQSDTQPTPTATPTETSPTVIAPPETMPTPAPESLPECPPGQPTPPEQAAAPAPVVHHEHHRSRIFAPQEVSLVTGAGASNYFGSPLTMHTDTGAAWDARLTFGAHSVFALEAGYAGATNSIAASSLHVGQITSNGLDGALRLQLPTRVQPYIFGGIGYNHMSVNREGNAVTANSFNHSDEQFTVPAGGGVSAYLGRHATLDVRGTYRMLGNNDITVSDSHALHQWTAQARIGYAF
jgi:opacity protein-like surface antigen